MKACVSDLMDQHKLFSAVISFDQEKQDKILELLTDNDLTRIKETDLEKCYDNSIDAKLTFINRLPYEL